MHHTLFTGLVLRCVYLGRRLGVGSPTSVVLIAPPPDTMPPPSWSERLSQYSSPYETSTSAPHGMSRVASVAMWHPLTDTYDGSTPLVLQLRWPARHGITSVKPVAMHISRLHSRPGSAEFPTASGQWPAGQSGSHLKHGAARGRRCVRLRSQRGRPRHNQGPRTSRHRWRSGPDMLDLRRRCEVLCPYCLLLTGHLLLFTNYLLTTYCLL